VENNNCPLNIRFVAKTSYIRNFPNNIRSDVKTSEVATLAMTLFSHCFRRFVHRRGHHVSGGRVVRPYFACGSHWLFLLSRHRKTISAAANQKPFCK